MGGPVRFSRHGLTATHADLVNRDLLAFCQPGNGRSRKSAAELLATVDD